MERKGKHHGNRTVFQLKRLDLEQNNNQNGKTKGPVKAKPFEERFTFEVKDQYDEKTGCEWIATSIEILKNHSKNMFECATPSKSVNKLFWKRENEFLDNVLVVVRFANFYPGDLDDQKLLQNPVKLSVRLLSRFDVELLTHHGKYKDHYKFALLCIDELSRLLKTSDVCHAQPSTDCFTDFNKMMIILFINKVDFKIFSIERYPKTLLDIKELQKHQFRDQTVLEYRGLIVNNNFRYLYDPHQQRFFYKKTVPIHDGTFIIDLIQNYMVNIDASCEAKLFDLYKPTYTRFHSIEGKYGKRMLHFH